MQHNNDNTLSSCHCKSVHEIKHKNNMYQMTQNQGSLYLLFKQTVMYVLNALVE